MLLRLLYDAILVPLLSEWLCDRELCALDCAVCNHIHRSVVLNLFTRSDIYISDLSNECVYLWAQRKGLRIRRALFALDDCSDELKDMLLAIDKFDYVEAQITKDIESILERKSIHHLVVICPSYNSTFQNMYKMIQSVRILNVSKVRLTICEYEIIAESAPNLEAITLNIRNDLDGLSVFRKVQVTKWTSSLSSGKSKSNGLIYTVRSLPEYYGSDEQLPSWALCVDGVVYELIELTASQSNDNVDDLIPFVENIQRFTISCDCQKLVDIMVRHCRALVALYVWGLQSYSSSLQSLILKCASSLSIIDLNCCQPSSLLAAVQSCSHLTQLSIYDVDPINLSLNQIMECCPWLSTVQLVTTTADDDVDPVTVYVGLQSVNFTGHMDKLELTVHNGHGVLTTSSALFQKEQFFILNSALTDIHIVSLPCDIETIQWIAQHCTQLRQIEVDSWSDITGDILMHLSSCEHLAALSLVHVRLLSDALIEQFLCGKPHLLKLCLYQCTEFDGGEVLTMIARYCRYIRHVTITRNTAIIDDDVAEFVDSCPTLRRLCLFRCCHVSKHLDEVIDVLDFDDDYY